MRIATHQDVINYIEKNYTNYYYRLRGGILYILGQVEFSDFKFDILPTNLVFDVSCNLDYSDTTMLPDDIVLNSCLYLYGCTNIKSIRAINIGGLLDISKTKIVLEDGIYVDEMLVSYDSLYTHLDDVNIEGYIMYGNILS